MIVERALEAVLIAVAINTGLQLFQSHRPPGTPELSVAEVARARRWPVVASFVTGALGVAAAAQVMRPGTLEALREDSSSHQWWRTFTSPFVQDSSLAGVIFNIVTAAVVVALAEWFWGRWMAAVIWLAGAWAPIGDLAHLAGYRVSAADVTVYGAGSSGATYFTAGTLCAALLLAGLGRDRLLALVGPAVAAVMWAVGNDGHGVIFLAGAVLGLTTGAAVIAVRLPTPALNS